VAAYGNAVRIIRHRGGDVAWELARRRPDPRLGPQVIAYTGYVETQGPVVRRREVASTVVPVIVNFGPDFRLLDSDDDARGRCCGSFVAGLHDTWTLVESTGRSHCLQIDFTPSGASRFLGLPIAELAGQVVELTDILGRETAWLVEQLQEIPDWDSRFRLLDRYLARRMAHGSEPALVSDHVWMRLGGHSDGIRIAGIAEELGCSHKHLISRFREAFGMTPKTVARLLRFEKAVDLIGSQTPTLADIAVDCGYCDQAHFHRDFRRFAGCTPTAFRERLVPDGGVIEARPTG
jgi:AraC-like DNA-binding protein